MEKIVVGVDGSRTAQQALAWLAAEARLRGAGFVVIPPAETVMDGHGSLWEG